MLKWDSKSRGAWHHVGSTPSFGTSVPHSGNPSLQLPEVFHWKDKWWITHCSADPKDYKYRKSNRTRGLFIGNLDWPDGKYPRLI